MCGALEVIGNLILATMVYFNRQEYFSDVRREYPFVNWIALVGILFYYGGYSVVYDEGRNIIFDNNYYFLDKPASKALEEATRNPIYLDSFDYAHYDIIDGLSSDIIDGS